MRCVTLTNSRAQVAMSEGYECNALGLDFLRGMVWYSRATHLETIPPRLLTDPASRRPGMGGQDHTPPPFGPREYHTIPRKKLEPWH